MADGLTKIIQVGGKDIPMRATAFVPRMYRIRFGRDMFRDLGRLSDKLAADHSDASQLDVMDLTVFEDLSYCMAKHADPSIPESPDEWLDTIDGTFSIYEALPQIMALWGLNTATTSVPAKN